MDQQTLVSYIAQHEINPGNNWFTFYQFHIAILALVLPLIWQTKVQLHPIACIFLALLLAAGDYVIINSLASEYAIIDAAHEQFRAFHGKAEEFQPKFYEVFVLRSFHDRSETTIIIGWLFYAFVAVGIIFAPMLKRWTSPKVSLSE